MSTCFHWQEGAFIRVLLCVDGFSLPSISGEGRGEIAPFLQSAASYHSSHVDKYVRAVHALCLVPLSIFIALLHDSVDEFSNFDDRLSRLRHEAGGKLPNVRHPWPDFQCNVYTSCAGTLGKGGGIR